MNELIEETLVILKSNVMPIRAQVLWNLLIGRFPNNEEVLRAAIDKNNNGQMALNFGNKLRFKTPNVATYKTEKERYFVFTHEDITK